MLESLSFIYNKIIKLIKSYDNFPQNIQVHIGETDSRQSAMLVIISRNEVRSRRNICEEILVLYGLDLYYQVSAQTDVQKNNVFDLLNGLSNFMIDHSKEFKLNWIESLSSPKIICKNNNGLDIFLLNFY